MTTRAALEHMLLTLLEEHELTLQILGFDEHITVEDLTRAELETLIQDLLS